MRSKTINFLLLLSLIVCVFGVSSYIFEKADDILNNLDEVSEENDVYSLYTNYEIEFGFRYNTSQNPTSSVICYDDTQLYTTTIFREFHLPKGSYVVIKDGYKFRPEVWVDVYYKAEEPEQWVSSNEKYYLNEDFWNKYHYVCFILSCDGGEFLKENFEEAFKIYVPEN